MQPTEQPTEQPVEQPVDLAVACVCTSAFVLANPVKKISSSEVRTLMSPFELNDCSAAGLDHWTASETEGEDTDEPQETKQRAETENVTSITVINCFIY